MGWLHKIFGANEAASGAGHATSQFVESDGDADEEAGARNAPRRELLQVILRDTMRQHGIPSDWIECRILSTASGGRPGLHVSFVVKQAHDRLVHYVFAFQQSFERELARFEPRAGEWMLSLGWEFRGYQASAAGMPDPASWARASAHAPLAAGDADAADLDRGFAPTTDPLGNEPFKSEDDVQRDLEALFAIRDAAMADTARRPPPRGTDFENTRPFTDSGADHR